MYRLLDDKNCILRVEDGAFIPVDPKNLDYQSYLRWVDEGHVPGVGELPSDEVVYLAWKRQREKLVLQIVVEVDGLHFDGDEDSQNRMARAVAAADTMTETTEWTLADNTVAMVTVQQLKTACRLAGEAQTAIWNEGRPARH